MYIFENNFKRTEANIVRNPSYLWSTTPEAAASMLWPPEGPGEGRCSSEQDRSWHRGCKDAGPANSKVEARISQSSHRSQVLRCRLTPGFGELSATSWGLWLSCLIIRRGPPVCHSFPKRILMYVRACEWKWIAVCVLVHWRRCIYL